MKRNIMFFTLIISSIFLIGCSFLSNKNLSEKPNDNENSINQNTNDNTSKPNIDLGDNTENIIENNEDTTKQIVRIYAFNREELQLYYFDEELTVEDNALVTALTNALQSSLPNDSFLSLSDKAKVSSANLDSEKGILTVVFSEDFIKDMPLGSGTESGLVSSLINTYGYNYNVDKVAIYFGDTLYTSLKGTLENGYFNTNFDDAKEYLK